MPAIRGTCQCPARLKNDRGNLGRRVASNELLLAATPHQPVGWVVPGRSGVRAVDNLADSGATAKTLAQAGHLSTAVVIADLR